MKSIRKTISVLLFCLLVISAFSYDSASPTNVTAPESNDVVQIQSPTGQNTETTAESSFSGEKVWYVTYMGIIIVFIVLVILMFVFQLMKYMKLQDKPKHNINLPKAESKPQPVQHIQQTVHTDESFLNYDEQEVAAIMAAIAVYENGSQFTVTNIKPAINKKSSKVHFSSMWGVAPSHTTWRTK